MFNINVKLYFITLALQIACYLLLFNIKIDVLAKVNFFSNIQPSCFDYNMVWKNGKILYKIVMLYILNKVPFSIGDVDVICHL